MAPVKGAVKGGRKKGSTSSTPKPGKAGENSINFVLSSYVFKILPLTRAE
jgi:hypothetical protein